jgi:hypothetical protein
MAEPRSAKSVIDQAIRENLWWERLCFWSAAALVVVGLIAIVRALLTDQRGEVTLAGTAATILFWPAVHLGQRVRKENMAMRLLEIPLGKAKTEEAAANMLHEMFQKIFVEKRG